MLLKELIAEYVCTHKLSYRTFAKQCELSPAYLSMIMAGFNPSTKKPPTVSVPKLMKIAHGMGITLHKLAEIVDDMPVSLRTESEETEDDAEIENLECEDRQIPQHEDDELWELRESMRQNPNMRVLFSTAKNATPKQLKQAIAVLEALKASDEGVE